jgi:hypothetical protein
MSWKYSEIFKCRPATCLAEDVDTLFQVFLALEGVNKVKMAETGDWLISTQFPALDT